MKGLILKCRETLKDWFNGVCNDDAGVGVVEVILILVVLIGLVVIFRDQLTSIINTIFARIAADSSAI